MPQAAQKNNLISERLVIITYALQINAKETAESNDPWIILINTVKNWDKLLDKVTILQK